jgi:hypothetical protein
MIKPLFYSSESTTVSASVDNFTKVTFPDGNGFSITVDSGAVVGGTPTYTLCVCNFNGDESDFIDILDATNIPLTDAIKSSSFEFAYLGIKYNSNSATGDVQIYLNVLN